jgi:adenine-specific DNA glycosylase
MVRRPDGADLGLWRRVDPARLVVPLDTHVHRIAYWLGLTGRRNPSWRTAVEVTDALREIDPRDPVRFDFALAHLGILGDCPRRPLAAKCAPCPLRPWCRAWRARPTTRSRASSPRSPPTP